MPFKPRKTGIFGTRWKHTGTILRSPRQYYRYKRHKAAFIRENHLSMHPHYAVEHAPPHMYPGLPPGTSVRDGGVIYPGDHGDHAATVVPRGTSLMATAPHDHQRAAGVPEDHLGVALRDRDQPARGQPVPSMVVLRREAPGAAPVLRTAVKRGPHSSPAPELEDVGRTQHSTLTGGLAVASAAIRMSEVAALDAVPATEDHEGLPAVPHSPAYIAMSSGHYRPDAELAAVKLAIAGKMAGSLNRRETEFREGGYFGDERSVDLTLKRRMKTVSDWAHPPGPARPSIFARMRARFRGGYQQLEAEDN